MPLATGNQWARRDPHTATVKRGIQAAASDDRPIYFWVAEASRPPPESRPLTISRCNARDSRWRCFLPAHQFRPIFPRRQLVKFLDLASARPVRNRAATSGCRFLTKYPTGLGHPSQLMALPRPQNSQPKNIPAHTAAAPGGWRLANRAISDCQNSVPLYCQGNATPSPSSTRCCSSKSCAQTIGWVLY